jgi:phenylacetate-CoA ligase
MLLQWKPARIRGPSSTMHVFAGALQSCGITQIHPKMIEISFEKISAGQRGLIEKTFNAPVCDCYASRELGTIACQCPDGGMHVAESRYLEIVRNDEVAPPGQMGEVVVTSLHQYAMPFIRYKLGDIAILDPNPCPCGRGSPVLQDVSGRICDFIVTSAGRISQGDLFTHLLRVRPEVVRYQVYQQDLHHIEVRLVCDKPVDDDWIKKLDYEIRENLDPTMHIDIKFFDAIPPSPSGKYRNIISEVKPDFVLNNYVI